MSETGQQEIDVEQVWRTFLTTGEYEELQRQRRLFKALPSGDQCYNCYAPFEGLGSIVARLIYKKERSNLNPHLCNMCEQFARQHQGGADIDLSLLFADVRGSTELAEAMPPLEYSRLINRFFDAVTRVMVRSDALIDKIIGDQLAAMYVPAFAGALHTRRALEAAQQVLAATGHDAGEEPWIPLGVGVHFGNAFVGSVLSEDGASDITVLGDAANTAARLASEAERGEILVSAAAAQEAGLQAGSMERRELALKGKSQLTTAYRGRAEIGFQFAAEE